jgi:isopenicillin-N N-acyltransferase like protein
MYHCTDSTSGIEEGAEIPFISVLALNVRTEIAYGLCKESDGCTAFSYHDKSVSILAQNWDWRPIQISNLIHLTIKKPGHTVSIITEAGILGKIGMNSAGWGVCLNAIRCRGVDYGKLPVHLALRKILDISREGMDIKDVKKSLWKNGIASSAHILVASQDSASGWECTHLDVVTVLPKISESWWRSVPHTNHLVRPHASEVKELIDLPDSIPRLERVKTLITERAGRFGYQKAGGIFGLKTAREILSDEVGYPASICREAVGESKSTTCFSIVMSLKEKKAVVKVGRPTEDGEEILIDLTEGK